LRKHIKFIVLILLAALILWWFGRGLDWAEVQRAVGRADAWWLTAATAVICLTYLLRAFRWRTLLGPLTEASIRELFVATTVGFGAVYVFGRAGEVVRPITLSLRDRRVRPAASFITLMVERLCDMIAVVTFFAANLLLFEVPSARATEFAHVRRAGLILLMLTALGLIVLVIFQHSARPIIKWLDEKFRRMSFVSERVRRALTSTLEQLAAALGVLANVRALAATTMWTAVIWLMIIVGYWLILRAFGLPFGLTESIFIMGWSLVGSLVPTPGGAAGAFHAATAAGLIFLGVTREQAMAIAIVMNIVLWTPALVFGLYYFLRGEIQIESLQQLATTESVEHAVEDDRLEAIIDKPEDELKAIQVND
jgi:uncharacterized protein (TIRG00374 family)